MIFGITALTTLLAGLGTTVSAAPATNQQRQSNNTDYTNSTSTGETYTGRATYYFQNGNAGACRNHHLDTEYIAAVSSAEYPKGRCGARIRVTNLDNGRTTYALVEDRCESCGTYDIDLSVVCFGALDVHRKGVIPVRWEYVSFNYQDADYN